MSLYRISMFCAMTSLLSLSSYAQLTLAPHAAEISSSDSHYPLSKMFTSIGKKNFPGVVLVRVEKMEDAASDDSYMNPYSDDLFQRFFAAPMSTQKNSLRQGSGFFVSSDGYIMTSAHIVAGASKIVVSFDRGRELEATLVGVDTPTDVAILKVEGQDFSYLSLGNSDGIDIGEWVTAVGIPSRLETSLSLGVVGAKGRQNLKISDFEDLIQTDAAINPGNSGGPLLNLNGEVIGMNTALLSASHGYTGVGFAIPSNIAKNVMPQIIDRGNVTLRFLGVSLKASENGDGVVVYNVVANSPADRAGITDGDLIIEYDGAQVKTPGFFRNLDSSEKLNSIVDIKIVRKTSCQL